MVLGGAEGEKSRRAGERLRGRPVMLAELRRFEEERAERGRRVLGGGGVMPNAAAAAAMRWWTCEELRSETAGSGSPELTRGAEGMRSTGA